MFRSFNSNEHLSIGKRDTETEIMKLGQHAILKQQAADRDTDIQVDFDHLHPRMIYEVMSLFKQKGSVNSYDLVEIIEKFEDVNTKENVAETSEKEYVKYANFSIEAMQDTLKNH